MMTVKDIGMVLDILEANYGQKFYDGVNRDNVLKLWSWNFQNDDPKLVMRGVQNCINTMPYKPSIADIRREMAQIQMAGQMTFLEAFQAITKAVKSSSDSETATKKFNEMSPILRKLIGFPEMLLSWHRVSDESYQTVVMSALRESYKELAGQVADYHALPKQLQATEGWRIEAPEQVSLPEPKKQKTMDELELEREQSEIEYRKRFGIEANPEMIERNREKYNAFISPMTSAEIKAMEEKLKQKFESKNKELSKEK